MRTKKGYAFIFVLCISILISAMLLGVLSLSLSAKRSTKTVEDSYKLSSMSEAGVEKGMSCLKQKINNNSAIFSNKSTPLKCDKFSFKDSGINCTVDFADDNTDSLNPQIIIHSKAETSKGNTKEYTVYIKKDSISNIYYDMLFNNVITTLGNKDETSDEYSTAFTMGNGVNDISLDGNMYLQGNNVDFRPKSNPAKNYNNSADIQYYDYSDSNGVIKEKIVFPNPDTIAATYDSGNVNINCNKLNIPISNTDADKLIFNHSVIHVNTNSWDAGVTDDAKGNVDSFTSNEYPILNVVKTDEDDDNKINIKNIWEALANIDKTIFWLSNEAYNPNYNIYLIPPSDENGNLAQFLIMKKDETKVSSFDFTHFIDYAKTYMLNRMPQIANETTKEGKEAKYKGIYKLYLIEGDVDFSIRWHYIFPFGINLYSEYINHIIYSTGKVNVHVTSGIDFENFSLKNSSILAKAVQIGQIPNRPISYYDDDYIKVPFERAVSLHGIKPIASGIDSNGLSPFNQANRSSINLFLLNHLTNYPDSFTFKIDKWVEK